MTRLLAVFTISVLALAASAPAAPTPEGANRPVYYFPVQKGARWVYLWTDDARGGPDEVVEVVSDVTDGADGAKVVTVARLDASGKAAPIRRYEVSPRGVFLSADRRAANTRLTCLLKLPHTSGQTWDNSFIACGSEKVKVPAGEFEALRVERFSAQLDSPVSVTHFAPGIGPVKEVWQSSMVGVLKSFTPGKN